MKARIVQINLDKRQALASILDHQNPNRDDLRAFLRNLDAELAEANDLPRAGEGAGLVFDDVIADEIIGRVGGEFARVTGEEFVHKSKAKMLKY